MDQPQTCPSCGAKNASSASWCNQCYSSLGTPTPAPPVSAPSPGVAAETNLETAGTQSPRPQQGGTVHQTAPSAPLAPQAPHTEQRGAEPPGTVHQARPAPPLAPASEPPGTEHSGQPAPGPTWVCKTCDTVNSMNADQCSVCNTTIFASFGAASEGEPLLEPDEAMRYALVPGLAHLKMDQGMHGITIGVLVAALWFMGVLLLFGGQILVALALLVISLVILGGSVHDAIRIAERKADEIILKPRILTMIGGLAVLMVIVVIWNQGFVS